MKTRMFAILLIALKPLSLWAALDFKENRIVHEATLDENAYTATFSFINSGAEPVTILEVSSSCGCTTALPSKRVFEPGESGEISATFDYGEREGKQVKSIRVETDLTAGKQIFLTLEVNIPTVMEITPSVVMWNSKQDSTFAAKEAIIESHMDEPIQILEVVSSNDQFTCEVKVLQEGKKFALSIKPPGVTKVDGIIRGTFIIKTSFPNPLKGTLKVYAIVR